MRRTASIDDILKPLDEAPSQAYLSSALQVADLLEWIVGQLGEAEIWQTSFSISEEFLRRLYFIRQRGQIRRLTLVLDHKATNKTLALWPFMMQVYDRIYLADNHSKVLLVKSTDGRPAAVITSQNLTRGNRAESAFVTTDRALFATLHAQLHDLIRCHAVPLSDLFAQRLSAAGVTTIPAPDDTPAPYAPPSPEDRHPPHPA